MGKFRLVLLIQPRRVDTEDHPQSTNRLVHESKLSARH
jgi:hypothetical protein